MSDTEPTHEEVPAKGVESEDEGSSDHETKQEVKSTTQAAATPKKAAATAGGVQGIQQQLKDVGDMVSTKLGIDAKQISSGQVVHDAKRALKDFLPNRALQVFFLIYSPFLVVVSGTVVGFLFQLFFQLFHFFLGLAGGAAVLMLFQSGGADDASPEETKKKVRIAILIASLLPIFMLDESMFIFQLVSLFVFAGTPFLINTQFPSPSAAALRKKNDDSEETKEVSAELDLLNLLEYSIAPAVIFVLSVGGTSYFNAIFLALPFAAACFLAQQLVVILKQNLPKVNAILDSKKESATGPVAQVFEALSLLFNENIELFFVLFEILIADTLLLFVFQSYIIPESIQEQQNSFFTLCFFNTVGLAVLFVATLLSKNADQAPNTARFTEELIPQGKKSQVVTYLTYAFLGGYGLLLLDHLIHQFIFFNISA
ncbi:hypothetical protein QOT17_018874 [Balamuthia mandrillaris]